MKPPITKDSFTQLYYYLQLGGKHTTQELSDKFALSKRTIQLYLKELREHYGLLKEKKYYYFDDEHRQLSQDERVQMSTALMIALYGCAIPVLHDGVKANFKNIPPQTDAFLFDLDFQEIKNESYFAQVVDAIIKQLALHFSYVNTAQKSSIKNVFPLKITNVLGYWYLMGYDLENDKVKTFYFNNIKELSTFDEGFLNQHKIQKLQALSQELKSPWFTQDKKSTLLKVGGDAMLYLQRQPQNFFKIIEKKENSLMIEIYYYNDIEVLNFVKKWIPFVKIVDDERLKTKLEKMLLEYLL
jgi:predicted DNA-binding transcriptional regulator YafY